MASLMPARISQVLTGQAVKNPAIIPICMRNQYTALAGVRWCGAGKNTKNISAIQPNNPISNAVSEAASALAASISPLAQRQAAHRSDGQVLEDDAQRDRGQVVADVFGAQREPGDGGAEAEDGELGDDVPQRAARAAVRDADRGAGVAGPA
jgi:hypothetical protein